MGLCLKPEVISSLSQVAQSLCISWEKMGMDEENVKRKREETGENEENHATWSPCFSFIFISAFQEKIVYRWRCIRCGGWRNCGRRRDGFFHWRKKVKKGRRGEVTNENGGGEKESRWKWVEIIEACGGSPLWMWRGPTFAVWIWKCSRGKMNSAIHEWKLEDPGDKAFARWVFNLMGFMVKKDGAHFFNLIFES